MAITLDGTDGITTTGLTSTGIDDNATSTAITIDASGNVGIGTASPSSKLEISNGSNISYTVDVTTGNYVGLSAYDNVNATYEILGTNASVLTFNTGSGASVSEAMRIDSSGRLLIGKTAVDNITDGVLIDGGTPVISVVNTSDRSGTFVRNGTDGTLIQFRKGASTVGSISVTGSSTSYNTSSDHRLKENVVTLDNATDRIKQIPVHRFNFIADPDTTVDGFLAHEVQDVVPEAISGTKDEVDDEGNPVYQGIDQSKLVPLLTAALQEAVATIEELKARVAALEAN